MYFRMISTCLLVAFAGPVVAADFVVEARDGAVERLLLSGVVSGGDRVLLASGSHGQVRIVGQAFDPAVTVMSVPGGGAILDSLTIHESRGLVVTDLTVFPRPSRSPERSLVDVDHSRDVVLERLLVTSATHVEGWDARDWVTRAFPGVRLRGRDLTLRDSVIRVVGHGDEARVGRGRVEGNLIEQFRGDGIRALGDQSVYSGNTIQGCVKVDGNHDDGIQSWSVGPDGTPGQGAVRDVLIEGNVIRGGRPDGPLGCNLQGIGLFDGMFVDWIIRNNVIKVDHWHGITVMGARNVLIENNIVVDEAPDGLGPPWITITAHKDGRRASGSLISGNTTQPRVGGGDPLFHQPQPGVTSRDNRVVETADEAFR